jgi:hypothetical protein
MSRLPRSRDSQLASSGPVPEAGSAPSHEPPPQPAWRHLYPYGHQDATESAGTIAAPLLAGFSVTLIAQLVSSGDKIRWADLAFFLLTGAVVMLLAAVQCSFWARQYVATPSDLEAWWPDLNHPVRWKQVRSEQWAHERVYQLWALRFRLTYRGGILFLLAAVPVLLVPEGSIGIFRGMAIALAVIGFFGEVIWVAAGWLLAWQERKFNEDGPISPGIERFDAELQKLQELEERRRRIFVQRPRFSLSQKLMLRVLRLSSALLPTPLLAEPPGEVEPPEVLRARKYGSAPDPPPHAERITPSSDQDAVE